MQTAGNNVANANTPGYSRQRVNLGSSLSYGIGSNLQIGTGVDVLGISRLVDDGLERRLQFQLGLVGSAELDDLRYREIESIFAEPDQGLSTSYKDLFGALDQLRTDPADRALRGGLIQAGGTISQQFNLISERLGDLSGSTFDEVRGLVRQVNQRTGAIARLNEQIIAAESNGSDANDLRDTRSQHIKELGKLLDTRAIERSSGSVDLLVGGNLVVAGARATDIRVGKSGAGSTELFVGKNKAPSRINDGRIAALIRQESSGLPSYTSRIDELARNTILEWNRLHSTGMPASGPFQSLVAAYGAVDGDGDGQIGDELLSQAGFEFPVERG
ncbi:MAG: flagellar hook-associated protein FlgK, partial [Planctomycetes bacterium]|nr:flagellar hook-associated protein FlgK [Planctomycetota bacterium]